MNFILYRVEADLIEPTATVIGAGSTCQTLAEAMAEQKRFEANPRYCNVRISKQQYGA